MMPRLPLTSHGASSAIAHGPDGAISVAQFHDDVSRLAAQLPAGKHALNTCQDRYLFMVGLGACLVSNRITLMPSTFTPDTLRRIQERYPDVFCLHDGASPAAGIPGCALPSASPRPIKKPVPAPTIDANQVAAIVFTSGSTGEPTAHVKRWGRLCINAAAESQRLGAAGLTIAATVPAQHMYGFESSVLLALQGGASLWRPKPFYPADIAAAVDAMPRPRMLVTTPFHLTTMVTAGVTMPPGDLLLCATAPLSRELAAQAEQAFGCPLIEIYGCTESGQVASRRTTDSLAWQLLPGLSMHEEGGVAEVFGGHVEGRVQLSDQIEQLDAEHFRLGGRHADMVNVAGKRTSLAALNAHLTSIDGVLDGCFLVPDADHAAPSDSVRRLVAIVVAPTLNATQLRQMLRQRIDPAFLPRPVYKVDKLPRNATGKLVASEITALYQALSSAGQRS